MRRAVVLFARGVRSLAAEQPAVPRELGPAAVHLTATGAWSGLQARWSHCACPGDMNLPPPKKVVVEYDRDEVDTFVAFADAVEDEFEGVLVDGVEVEGRPQAFDVKLEDGRTIFTGTGSSLPQHSDLFARLRDAGLQASSA